MSATHHNTTTVDGQELFTSRAPASPGKHLFVPWHEPVDLFGDAVGVALLVDGVAALALGTFSPVVKDNGRRFSMPSRSTSLSSRGAWSASTSTRTPAWSPGA
ncbi:hypothetical protein [Streptomyces sp. NPDC055400]